MNKHLKEALDTLGLLSVTVGIGTALVYVSVMSYQCATNSEFFCPAPFSWVFKTPNKPTNSASVPTPTNYLTLEKYNNLKSGMSYNEATTILGTPGTEASRVEIPNTPTTILYTWQNPDGTNLNATFQNDKLVTKAQYGLK